ncbi:hypothetical protein P378_14080 [Desulforamulus profundi]|uniref:Uncharacterized protein n=1 Tax=Desulforamulus profundi TaxID=1383067 RepID=A0A2C6LHG0_9FIRM|nr:hypothetical protein P378_14080 [Desulforamulus profundi]
MTIARCLTFVTVFFRNKKEQEVFQKILEKA